MNDVTQGALTTNIESLLHKADETESVIAELSDDQLDRVAGGPTIENEA